MPTFAFSGRTRGGETISGERMGDTVEARTAAADSRATVPPG